jgi:hypothetical protein
MGFHRRATWLIGLAALVLSLAVMTADAQASSEVYVNAAWANQPVEPTQFGPNEWPGKYGRYAYFRNWVQGLQWSSWGGPEATATGNVVFLANINSPQTTTSPVIATFGGLTTCGGQLVYTMYSLKLQAGAQQPDYWSQAQTGTFPCHVSGGGWYPSDPYNTKTGGPCGFSGLSVNSVPWLPLTLPINVRWSPNLPPSSAYTEPPRLFWRQFLLSDLCLSRLLKLGGWESFTRSV